MSELIDRQVLKDYVSSLSTHPLNEWDTWGVLAAIDKQPTITAPRWRMVEDGLPKDYGDYLGYADGEVMFLLFNPDTTDKWKWSACDAEGRFDVSVDEVTHWMPLPEPPQEDA